MKEYSKVADLLNQLLTGYPPTSKKLKMKHDIYLKPVFSWMMDVKQLLKNWSLAQAPILAFANPQLTYVLHVDISREGLCGVLYQDQGEGLKPIAFISRSLFPSERNYTSHKLEFWALKWAVVDKLNYYLCGTKFEVRKRQ